ncbi:RNA-binding protein FUS [Aplysia californica]|uniref:RNA-binding protein FUS n=1 Tax=Aplysia californica TaxID=6500 RepID=A0ABM1W4L1_APLCA|nr:RNA-binding protein FUS [Aplysia californica]XP_035829604.1 RNA-binding protein FUS [Aplysia californica]
MSIKQSKTSVELERASLSAESGGHRRYSGSFREKRQQRHSSQQLTTDSSSTLIDGGKRSPNSSVRHRRPRECNSSQESLSSPGQQRASSRASSTDLRERKVNFFVKLARRSTISDFGEWSRDDRQGSPSHTYSSGGGGGGGGGSRSGSPDKPHNTFERPSSENSFHDAAGDRGFGSEGSSQQQQQLQQPGGNNNYNNGGGGGSGGGARLSPPPSGKKMGSQVDGSEVNAGGLNSFERALNDILGELRS